VSPTDDQGFERLAGASQLSRVEYIEHEKIVAARSGTVAAVSMRREFEVIGSARQPDHHAVISVVAGKAVQFGQTQDVMIEGADLVQSIGWPRDADLRRRDAVPEG
jgi:hypothetical protein